MSKSAKVSPLTARSSVWKTKLEMEGILEEMRRLRAHETPKERSKRKARATAKRGKIRFRYNANKPATLEPASAI